ncbi:hypothetical protein GCK32_004435 [Trichostrongylus colubriformis]|uniref:Uncharacterized protein n=1 Tax=Trichostrongylus colubriformis TaxID=6319 RepID=A0AAN8F8L9_TRICO
MQYLSYINSSTGVVSVCVMYQQFRSWT